MAWVLRVVASFGVIKPLQHQLGSSCWWKELRLQQGRHRLEELAHCKFLRSKLFHLLMNLLAVLVASKQAVVL